MAAVRWLDPPFVFDAGRYLVVTTLIQILTAAACRRHGRAFCPYYWSTGDFRY